MDMNCVNCGGLSDCVDMKDKTSEFLSLFPVSYQPMVGFKAGYKMRMKGYALPQLPWATEIKGLPDFWQVYFNDLTKGYEAAENKIEECENYITAGTPYASEYI